jgi:hypothetical protein
MRQLAVLPAAVLAGLAALVGVTCHDVAPPPDGPPALRTPDGRLRLAAPGEPASHVTARLRAAGFRCGWPGLLGRLQGPDATVTCRRMAVQRWTFRAESLTLDVRGGRVIGFARESRTFAAP